MHPAPRTPHPAPRTPHLAPRTSEGCREELQEVLEEWIILKIRDKDIIPSIGDLEIKIREEAAA